MADEYLFDVGIVIHDHAVTNVETIMDDALAIIDHALAMLPHNVRVYLRPIDGMHATCDNGACKIESLH